eukprot:CAMPEP_0197045110 /NCGR_PEP_ID=MMETSP1384-20130603/21043_1 /TAXON_ID=29189 /ORGANISM="Ammonia sp." /LENGTH=59 /DNA_ID=CAMNT_0042476677 /DNA_START=236 /DNA_END=412 /DNA_ORIENTATION=-
MAQSKSLQVKSRGVDQQREEDADEHDHEEEEQENDHDAVHEMTDISQPRKAEKRSFLHL